MKTTATRKINNNNANFSLYACDEHTRNLALRGLMSEAAQALVDAGYVVDNSHDFMVIGTKTGLSRRMGEHVIKIMPWNIFTLNSVLIAGEDNAEDIMLVENTYNFDMPQIDMLPVLSAILLTRRFLSGSRED